MEDLSHLKKVIDKIQKLPTLPLVVQNIMRMVENPRTTAKDINRVISTDPALASKVLRLVNSAFYGFPRRISTVTDAIIILGFNTVRSLALSASIFDVFRGESLFFDRNAFWQHSVAVGVCGQLLAKRLRYAKAEEVMIAGILHDIGKIALDQFAHEEFNNVFGYVREKEVSFLAAERAVLGCDHGIIGKWMANQWNFPPSLLEPIAYHHTPQKSQEVMSITAMIHLSDIIVKSQNIGFSGDSIVPKLDNRTWNELGLNKSDVQKVIDELQNEVKKADIFLLLAQS